jgi:hypothetical protein
MCLLSELLCLADTLEREPFSEMDSSRITGYSESAGINRHVVGDARALQERK